MVTAQNKNIFRIITFNIFQILENRIRRTGIPVRIFAAFIWRQQRYAAIVPVQIPRNTDSNMCVQS